MLVTDSCSAARNAPGTGSWQPGLPQRFPFLEIRAGHRPDPRGSLLRPPQLQPHSHAHAAHKLRAPGPQARRVLNDTLLVPCPCRVTRRETCSQHWPADPQETTPLLSISTCCPQAATALAASDIPVEYFWELATLSVLAHPWFPRDSNLALTYPQPKSTTSQIMTVISSTRYCVRGLILSI